MSTKEMEDELSALKEQLVGEEKKLAELVEKRSKMCKELEEKGDTANLRLKKDTRYIHNDILAKEGDICILKKKIKQLTYKLEIASKMSKLEMEDDISDLKVLIEDVGKRLKKNKEKAVETFDNMIKIQEAGQELAKGIEESRQKAMGECDVRSDKLMARLDVRQAFVDQKKAEIREMRRASGIPDPSELAEIRRLAALNQSASGGNDDDEENDE